MTDTPASKALTESLLSLVRQQRHYGARVLISTQEPTVSPRLIDLGAMAVVHRFSSPEWMNVLKKHISILENSKANYSEGSLFNQILRLKTGEALVFARPVPSSDHLQSRTKWPRLENKTGLRRLTS